MKILYACFSFLLLFQVSRAQDVIEFIPFAEGLNSPLDIVNAGDSMLYVVEKRGIVKLIDPQGNVLPDPFLDIENQVNSGAGERGLLGLVFHPAYPDSPYLYVNYTDYNGGRTVISRFETDASNFAEALPNSEKTIMTIPQPFNNHNGGDLAFGPDGYLYIPTGDGGSGGDPQGNGQNLMAMLGKLHRIDVDNGDPYSIPDDNPFAFDDFAADEIWSYGLRNPWRVDFDPQTGDLYIADVGQNAWEEINVQEAGAEGGQNYGWRCYEADATYNPTNCQDSGYVFPVHAYPHIASISCRASITGGVVYRGMDHPGLQGKYLFADYCTGMVGALYRDQNLGWVADTIAQYDPFEIAAFGRDYRGEVYMAAIRDGDIFKIADKNSSINNYQNTIQLALENPVRNKIIIIGDLEFDSGIIFNSQGKQMKQLISTTRQVDVSTWPTGLYIISLRHQNNIYNQKIIVTSN